MQSLAEYVKGKRVALVGNAMSMLVNAEPDFIDGHDVVIRINLGLPGIIAPFLIGERTDIWASAKYWPEAPVPDDAKFVLFMKLTELGDKHWEQWNKSAPHCPLLRWPKDYEEECRKFVGADPGTGVRLLWWLKTKTQVKTVSLVGFDCWKSPSHWSGRRNTPNHSPDLEQAAIDKLMAP
jgi:hypothetical protein